MLDNEPDEAIDFARREHAWTLPDTTDTLRRIGVIW